MKRIVLMLCAVLLITSALSVGALAISFKDINGNEYYAESAKALAELGIINGYEDGKYHAEKNITRAEMATIVCRVLGKTLLDTSSTKFTDTPKSHWASGYVTYAANEGIIGGDGDGKFRPEDNVKYEEALKMTVCTVDFDRCLMPNALDWSAPYIAIAKANGITVGLTGSKGKAATRGDVAVMIYNAIKARDSKVLSVPDIIQDTLTVKSAEFKTYTGSLTKSGQVNTHTFVPSVSGAYRFELSGIVKDSYVEFSVVDGAGKNLWHYRGFANEGASLEYLEKGKTYTVKVGQYIGNVSYTLKVGCQKPAVDARNYNVIKDSLEYSGQINYYGFVPKINGNYAVSIEGLKNGAKVELIVLNDKGEKIWNSGVTGNTALPLEYLTEGKTYTVQVRQYTDLSSYTLKIGLYKTPFYAEDLIRVNDSIEYNCQTNTYGFVASKSSHTFTLSGVSENAKVSLVVYNSKGEALWNESNVQNTKAVVNNLKAGETYVVQVCYYHGASDYSLNIN